MYRRKRSIGRNRRMGREVPTYTKKTKGGWLLMTVIGIMAYFGWQIVKALEEIAR